MSFAYVVLQHADIYTNPHNTPTHTHTHTLINKGKIYTSLFSSLLPGGTLSSHQLSLESELATAPVTHTHTHTHTHGCMYIVSPSFYTLYVHDCSLIQCSSFTVHREVYTYLSPITWLCYKYKEGLTDVLSLAP